MKKIVKSLLVLVLTLSLCACSSNNPQNGGEVTNSTDTNSSAIHVYTRDASSGTREAFETAIALDGELTEYASEVSSNGDMATKVGTDGSGIGYVSLSTDFKANKIKPLAYEGVSASNETVLDGSYLMQRPFNYVLRSESDFENEDIKELSKAFIAYLTESVEGLTVVEENGGIVNFENARPWEEVAKDYPVLTKDNSALTIRTGGSTSVEKIVRAGLESFSPLAGNVNYAMNQTGSSDAVKRTLGEEKDGANAVEIGFASRNFKAEEDTTNSLSSGQMCIDAVVVVVNENNPLENITASQVHDIYTGVITDFSKLS